MTTVSSDLDPPPNAPKKRSAFGRGRIGASRLGMAPSRWHGGLAAARRHTILVRVLRGGALAVCALAAVLVLGGAWLAGSGLPLIELSAGQVGFDGTRVTLATPKISGFQIDRRPYAIKARSGIQDLTTPHLVELLDIEVGIGTAADETMRVMASHAEYDRKQDRVVLTGDVRIANTSGYDLSLQAAAIDFKAGTLVSDTPVRARLDGATIEAGRMTIDDHGHSVTFRGGVKSSIEPDARGHAGLAVSTDPLQ